MLAVGTILEVAYYCRLATKQNAINVMHYRVDTLIPDPITMEQVADAFSGNAGPAYRPMLFNGNSYDGCKVRIPGPLGTAAVISRASAGVGTSAGAGQAPTQLCVVASLRAATAPARVRGRQYFGGFTKDDIDISGDPTLGLQTSVNVILNATAINPLVLTIAAANYTFVPVIYRRATLISYPVTSRVVRLYFGTQRRRSEINRGDAAL
jgi:hypothetical protein